MDADFTATPGDGSPLRVGHLIASEFAGGPEKQILGLSDQLRSRGWSVTIGSFLEGRPSVEILDRAEAAGFPTFAIDTRGPFDPSAIFTVRRELRAHGLDVLVTHGYKANIVGRLATIGVPTRPLATVRGYTAATKRVVLYEKLDRIALRTFPMALTVSEGTRTVLRRYGLPDDRFHVLHNAVDCHVEAEPLDLPRELSLPPGARVLVAAGRLSPEKGHRYLVEAMARVREQDEHAYCVVLGEGHVREDLEARIRHHGLEDRFLLAGFRGDVLRWLRSADLVVNPSLTEGLPNVVLEAMSQSTAVVATRVGGVGELLEDGVSGWLVEPGRPQPLADAILTALEDDSRRKEVARRARQTAVEHFSFEKQAALFRDYCRRLLAD